MMKIGGTAMVGAAALIAFLAGALATGAAEAREVPADMKRYCKQRKMTYIGYVTKRKHHACGVYSWGFNTQYLSKIVNIDLTTVCRRQHRTKLWRFRGDKVWCIIEEITTLRLCNRRHENVYAVIAYWNGEQRRQRHRGWVSRGWWTIPPGECQHPSIRKDYKGFIYVFGRARSGELTRPDHRFCINDGSAFTLGYADRSGCRQAGYKRVGMSRMNIRTGKRNTWTFN